MTAADPFLFKFSAAILTEELYYDVDVPYGAFALKASTNDIELTRDVDPTSYRLPSGASVTVWQNTNGRLELFRSSVTGQLYEGAYVDGCEAAIWRFQALRDDISLKSQCTWTSLPDKADGGPDAGQNLDALTWDIGSTRVSLGTEDDECLKEFARQGRLPARWESLISSDTVRYRTDGLQVVLPELEFGEECEIIFLVAWNIPPNDDDASTWASVKTGATVILERAGCR
ncbi:hypothetical protein [Pelagibius sp. Alg239-R121]|uniref:hypothetical protein n=1 Tax=Pelagibius sp. Alg239-R121 TaxID=2993448 RepID=UPI0024A72E9F|nr:hypothetical protein [Pelagibius sp. Alg239-R121]